MASSTNTMASGTETEGPLQAAAVKCSPGLSQWLARHRTSIALSSYQAGQLFLVGRFADGTISLYRRDFGRAMGLWSEPGRLFLGSSLKIWRFENVLGPDERANHQFDALYVPRTAHVTGEVDIHEMVVEADGRLVFAATRYSCLATLSATHSLKPVWKPSFVSQLTGDDRCHLNGVGLENGFVSYVTACGRGDAAEGWRAGRRGGGVLIRLEDGSIIAEGFSMPHSPRVHDGALYLLDSGRGYLVRVDPATGRREDVAFCPGFLRGLAIHDGYALATLSLPRNIVFEGLPLQEELEARNETPRCGLAIIHLATGRIEEWIWFDTHIREMFDVAVIPGIACPMAAPQQGAELANLITFENGQACPDRLGRR
ncbi:TIGR03032 family protein [Aquabacter sp. CN5-332]|uniref:TIGR03032 family protein n=1 Tax=Aquabacter sp. CN5-332 TaxID=3156608 RepID=UPI0032B55D65